MVGEPLFEEVLGIPTEVEFASEFRHRKSTPKLAETIFIALSQSGETADVLSAARLASPVLAICNVPGSSLHRESSDMIFLHAGPEVSVASTKNFTAQLATLVSLACGPEILRGVPAKISAVLETSEAIRKVAIKYLVDDNFLFLGRGYNFPIALEGALKLKEISYVHAEGFPAAELKHGPLALVNSDTPSVVIAPNDALFDKNCGTIQEIRARSGPVIAVATEKNGAISSLADDVIWLPEADERVVPILAAVALQLFAYHFAIARGCDVDRPRNLAKCVTVE